MSVCQRTGGFVHDEHLGPAQQGTAQAHQLALPDAQVLAVCAQSMDDGEAVLDLQRRRARWRPGLGGRTFGDCSVEAAHGLDGAPEVHLVEGVPEVLLRELIERVQVAADGSWQCACVWRVCVCVCGVCACEHVCVVCVVRVVRVVCVV